MTSSIFSISNRVNAPRDVAVHREEIYERIHDDDKKPAIKE